MKSKVISFILSVILLFSVVPTGITLSAYAETKPEEIVDITERESLYTVETTDEYMAERYGAIASGVSDETFIKEFEKAAHDTAVACGKSVDLNEYNIRYSESNKETLAGLIQTFIDKYPELYHIKSYGFSIRNSEYIVSLNFTYYYTAAEYKAMNNEVDSAVNKYFGDVIGDFKADKLSDAQLLLLLHDRIAAVCEYDYDNFLLEEETGEPHISDDSYNMYGTLVKKIAVCQGYAKTYQMILNDLGIKNWLCSSSTLGHVWNIVELNGKYYHVDITWDDPVYDISGQVYHTNFLRSTEGIIEEGHEADDFDTTPIDTNYDNYFWQDSQAAFTYLNGKIYYIDSEKKVGSGYGAICDWDGNAIYNIEEAWKTKYGGTYTGCYSRLYALGDKLYFNGVSTVYALKPGNSTAKTIFSPVLNTGKSIYGLGIEDDQGFVEINESPNFTTDTKKNGTQSFEIDLSGKPTFALNANEIEIKQGDTFTLSVVDFDDGGSDVTVSDARFTSSDTSVATVDEKSGEVFAVGKGYALITCSISGVDRNCRVYVLGEGEIIFSSDNINIGDISNRTYDGKAQTVSFNISYNEEKLVEGDDYTVKYSNNINAGTATIVITGIGVYVGEIEKTFEILPYDISTSIGSVLKQNATAKTYNGKAQTLSMTFKLGGNKLVENTDYKLEYKNNVNAGKATVKMTGIGNFAGSASAEYTINPKSIVGSTVSGVTDKAYTGAYIIPSVTVVTGGKRLALNTDYRVSGSNNKYAGKAVITILGTGNYTGSISKTFYIHPAKVTGLKFSSATKSSIKISWKKSSSGTGYAVQRATSQNGKYSTVALIGNLKTVSYTDKKVAPNKTYYYKIIAYKSLDGGKITSVVSAVLKTATATKTPKLSSAKAKSGKKAYLSWKKVSGASGYTLYMSTKKSSGYKAVYSGKKLNYTKTKLKKGTTYYFKLRTYKVVNGNKIYSDYSSYKKVKITK